MCLMRAASSGHDVYELIRCVAASPNMKPVQPSQLVLVELALAITKRVISKHAYCEETIL